MSSDKPAVPGVLITETAYDLVSAFLYACRDHRNLRPDGCDHFPDDLIEAFESCPPGLVRRDPGELSGNTGQLVDRLRRRALRILDDARSEFVNPDGPAAADEIERLNATIARLQSERAADGEALEEALDEITVNVRRIAMISTEAPNLETVHDATEWAHCAAVITLCSPKFRAARARLARRSSPDTRGGDLGSLRPEKASVPSVSGDQT